MAKDDEQSSGKDKPGGGGGNGGGGGPKKIKVSITSFDGNIKHHPFDASDTVGDVRMFAYDKLVQQKDQITLDRTWIEFNRERVDDSVVLSSLAARQPGGGGEPDLTLSLTWDTGGGGR